MPKPGFLKGTSPPRSVPNEVYRDDVGRGEQRFAAEVMLAQLRGDRVPGDAQQRAVQVLEMLAKG